MAETICVHMAQLAVAKIPDKIETQALGSCVGIVLYDSYTKIGGLAHTMLPEREVVKKSSQINLAKFADTATEELVKKMISEGAKKRFINAKLAGGADMFPEISKQGLTHIGKRNIDAAKAKLKELNIPIIAEDIGGTFGRTITLDTVTGKLKVRSIARGEKEI